MALFSQLVEIDFSDKFIDVASQSTGSVRGLSSLEEATEGVHSFLSGVKLLSA